MRTSLIKKLTNQSYEVYFDGSYITPDQEAAIINGVRQRLIREGKPLSLLGRVVSGRAPGGALQGMTDLATQLERHRIWRESRELEGERAEFTDVDFAGASLAGVDLRYATFTRATLAGCDLHGADLLETVWNRSTLVRPTCATPSSPAPTSSRSNLAGARPRRRLPREGAVAPRGPHGASLRGANLLRVEGGKTSLAGADLTGAEPRRHAAE